MVSWQRHDNALRRRHDAAIGGFIARYYPESPEKQLLQGGHFKVVFLEYDWTLNSRYLARLKG